MGGCSAYLARGNLSPTRPKIDAIANPWTTFAYAEDIYTAIMYFAGVRYADVMCGTSTIEPVA